jgi:hypothetical protein
MYHRRYKKMAIQQQSLAAIYNVTANAGTDVFKKLIGRKRIQLVIRIFFNMNKLSHLPNQEEINFSYMY